MLRTLERQVSANTGPSLVRTKTASREVRLVTNIDYIEVQRLVKEGALLVEVLGEEEFDAEHIPGAISLPLKDLSAKRAQSLDKERPVIVYCFDYQ